MSYRILLSQLVPDVDARYVEAWMRLELGTLDALSETEFAIVARAARRSVLLAGRDTSERLAQSFGLGG